DGDRVLRLRAQDAGRDRLRPGAFKLGAGLRDVGGRDDAGVVLVLRDAQRFGIGGDRGVEQPLQLVGDTKLDVIGGELPLGGKAGGRRAGGGGGGGGGVRPARAAGSAPPRPGPRPPPRSPWGTWGASRRALRPAPLVR